MAKKKGINIGILAKGNEERLTNPKALTNEALESIIAKANSNSRPPEEKKKIIEEHQKLKEKIVSSNEFSTLIKYLAKYSKDKKGEHQRLHSLIDADLKRKLNTLLYKLKVNGEKHNKYTISERTILDAALSLFFEKINIDLD